MISRGKTGQFSLKNLKERSGRSLPPRKPIIKLNSLGSGGYIKGERLVKANFLPKKSPKGGEETYISE